MELNGVEETLLIPLVIKANETLRKKPRITDNKAVEILKELNIDRISLSKFDKFISHEGVVARTIMLDAAVKKAINQWPNANIISIGCGLDARFERVDNGIINWYNLDFPNVIELRKKFFDENPDFMMEFPISRDKLYLLKDSIYRGILRRIKQYEKCC